MATPDEFARNCREVSRQLRALPSEMRRELSSGVQDEVAVPEASRVKAALSGPWGSALAASTKARKLADPTIVVGGTRRVVSGGASGRDLVYGSQFGGGGRVSTVTRRGPGRPSTFRRRSTRQFAGKGRETILPTIRRDADLILAGFARIVDRVLERL